MSEQKDSKEKKFEAKRSAGRPGILGDGADSSREKNSLNLAEHWASGRKFSPLLVGAIVVVLLVALLAIFYSTGKSDSVEGNTNSEEGKKSVELDFFERSTPAEIRRATEDAIRGFMNAKSNVERCRFVIGEEKLKEKMDEFYARFGTASTPLAFGKLESADQASFGGRAMMIALATEPSGKRAWMYNLFPVGDGMRIDWETSVSYGEYSWPRFLREQPEEAIQMRVYLKRLPLFKMRQRLASEYDTYELTAFGETQTANLFMKKDSEVTDQLRRYVPANAKHPMNLLLRWEPGKGGEKEIQLEKILHNLWADEEWVMSGMAE